MSLNPEFNINKIPNAALKKKEYAVKDKNEEDENYEKVEFAYDDPAGENEIKNLQGDIESDIAKKAFEMGIATDEELRKFLSLAEIDLASLHADALVPLNLKKGELDFIRESIDEALSKCWRNKSGELKVEPVNTDKIVQFTEFIEKYHEPISLFMLTQYIASYGPMVAKDLAGAGVNIDYKGETISLKDVMEHPELAKKIEAAGSTGSVVDISEMYYPQNKFEDKENGCEFSFRIKSNVQKDNTVEKKVVMGDTFFNEENRKKLDEDLKNNDISFDDFGGNCHLDDFIKNKEKIIDIFSVDLKVPREEVAKYFESFINPNITNVSVVELKDFKINQTLQLGADDMKLQKKQNEVYGKYEVYDEKGKMNMTNWVAAGKELNAWGKANGYDNFDQALTEEAINKSNAPLQKLKVDQQNMARDENFDKFKSLFLEDLEKSGYTLPQLKATAQENPEKVLNIIAEVLGKNIDYDYTEYNYIEAADKSKGLSGEEAAKDNMLNYQDQKYADGVAYSALHSGSAVCWSWGETFIAAKEVLEEKGVPHMDQLACISTTSEALDHLFVVCITAGPNGPVVTYVDPTWYDTSGELNAVDSQHYYGAVKEKRDAAHQAALAMIEQQNVLVSFEQLNQVFSQYDPKSFRKEHGIELNREAYEEMKKYKKGQGTQREYSVEDDREPMQRIMEKIQEEEKNNPKSDEKDLETMKEEKQKESQSLIDKIRKIITSSK